MCCLLGTRDIDEFRSIVFIFDISLYYELICELFCFILFFIVSIDGNDDEMALKVDLE